ncbi:MAG: threonine synthase [Acidobacteria bacterium]|nr:threonine synthase [Acidobacteriota bacterium]
MMCVSTRGRAPRVNFRTAVLAGLAPDGGLYVPESWPRLEADAWHRLRGASLAEIGVATMGAFMDDSLDGASLRALLAEAINFPVPIVPLTNDLSVVELFHGPTFAFKDFGARVLARLMSRWHTDDAHPLTVLVATSGDTGGAVAQAFHGVPRTRVVVLYPHGRVSAVQEAQFTTLGGNVRAVAVEGSFDDCQRLAKEAFADAGLRDAAHLTSANSISLGRLLPQMVYYACAAVQHCGPAPLAICVPSGNVGNLAAGLMVQRLGAPIVRFHAATNVNDTVPRYLETGHLEVRPSVATISNAMDVGNPSNLERVRWMFGDDLQAVRQRVGGSAHGDAEVRDAMRTLDHAFGYVADPHTAVGYLGAQVHLGRHPGDHVMVLSTAHPAKFGDVVHAALGHAAPVPEALSVAMARPRLATHVMPVLDDLRPLLTRW